MFTEAVMQKRKREQKQLPKQLAVSKIAHFSGLQSLHRINYEINYKHVSQSLSFCLLVLTTEIKFESDRPRCKTKGQMTVTCGALEVAVLKVAKDESLAAFFLMKYDEQTNVLSQFCNSEALLEYNSDLKRTF